LKASFNQNMNNNMNNNNANQDKINIKNINPMSQMPFATKFKFNSNNNKVNQNFLDMMDKMNKGEKINQINNQISNFNQNNNQINSFNQNNNQISNFNQNNQINNFNQNNIQINSFNQNNNQINNFNQNVNNNQINNSKDIQQNDLYNRLMQKNFNSPPAFNTILTKDTAKISLNDKPLLNKILKVVKIFFVTPLEILYKEQYDISKKTSKEREKCPICLCEFYDDIIPEGPNLNMQNISVYINHEINVVKLYRCDDHFYHIECLSQLIKDQKGFKCAMCQKIYGILEGTMPPGSMTARISKSSRCQGYPHDSTIVISYNIPSGYQNGKYYSGTSRVAYLPNNKDGREVLALLKIAFDRKLTFVVGTSVTTGQKNTTIWNGIHHKTSLSGGTNNYGYPDATYFNRVREELASKGVLKDDFGSDELDRIAKNLLKGY